MRLVMLFILISTISYCACERQKPGETKVQKKEEQMEIKKSAQAFQPVEKQMHKKTEEQRDKEKVRKSVLAGSWYPADSSQLQSMLLEYLDKAQTRPVEDQQNKVFALISPHAGYQFSGPVAAYGYKLLAGKNIRRVIILGTSHHAYFKGASIADAKAYETPLGKVYLDKEAVKELKENPLFQSYTEAHKKEHSVEIQLPFLQVTLNEFTIVPLLIGRLDKEKAQSIAESLKKLIDEETMIVVSSDFTHYGPNYQYIPFTDNVQQKIESLNMASFKAIESLDVDSLINHKLTTGDTICGFYPIMVLLSLADTIEGVSVKLLAKDTSGNIVNDFTNSVSYLSIAMTRPVYADQLKESSVLDETEKETLLKIARLTLKRSLEGAKFIDLRNNGIELTENLKKNCGVFVTLNKHGKLRGCIGTIVPVYPLYKGVIDNTINAAFKDPRFLTVTKEEEDDIDIGISVLTPPKEVESYRDIVPGRDGIILSKFDRSAVFLPQVMVDNRWTTFTALRYLSRKAGLDYEDWRHDTQFYVFSAQVFED